MPTFRERETADSMTHPNQTWYYILAQPPDVGNVTYQVTPRAAEFFVETLGYTNHDDLPWSLVSPLRQIKDLFTKDEGGPSNAEPDNGEIRTGQSVSIDEPTKEALLAYLESHPDVDGDLSAAGHRLTRNDPTFVDHLERVKVTQTWEQYGGDPTPDDSLGQIAQKYFGRETHTPQSTRSATITVTARNGDTYDFPSLDQRNRHAEAYRVAEQIYRRWGPLLGNSIVNTARYKPGAENFPNRWIGQTATDPEPSLDNAVSPMAYYYRTVAAYGEGEPGQKLHDQFDEACEHSLETYRANFPTAVDPDDLETEYQTVAEATKPWEDFQLPPQWLDRHDGPPPLVKGVDDTVVQNLSESLQRNLQHLENYPESLPWLLSHLNDEVIGPAIKRVLRSNLDVSTLELSGYGSLLIELTHDELAFEIDWQYDGDGDIALKSDRLGGTHAITVKNWHIVTWDPPRTDGIHDTQTGLFEQSKYFATVRDVIDQLGKT